MTNLEELIHLNNLDLEERGEEEKEGEEEEERNDSTGSNHSSAAKSRTSSSGHSKTSGQGTVKRACHNLTYIHWNVASWK